MIAVALVLLVCWLVEHKTQLLRKTIVFGGEILETVPEDQNNFSAHFINVGQGDCTLLKCKDDVVLIDCGEAEANKAVEDYLDARAIKEIDYFVITHMHSDHMGGASEIFEDYTVKNVIMTKLTEQNTPTTDIYKNLLLSIKDSGAKVYSAQPGDEYKLDNFSFTVLSPSKNYTELNNTSVVVRAVYGKTSYIFMGDAEMYAEKDILGSDLELDSDVIKIGHHGSKTSTSESLLDAVTPQIAVISCGLNNSFHHPHDVTIENLTKRNIDIYRTDTFGNIIISSDGEKFYYYTEGKNNYGKVLR